MFLLFDLNRFFHRKSDVHHLLRPLCQDPVMLPAIAHGCDPPDLLETEQSRGTSPNGGCSSNYSSWTVLHLEDSCSPIPTYVTPSSVDCCGFEELIAPLPDTSVFHYPLMLQADDICVGWSGGYIPDLQLENLHKTDLTSQHVGASQPSWESHNPFSPLEVGLASRNWSDSPQRDGSRDSSPGEYCQDGRLYQCRFCDKVFRHKGKLK
jgi:hypothetical protein